MRFCDQVNKTESVTVARSLPPTSPIRLDGIFPQPLAFLFALPPFQPSLLSSTFPVTSLILFLFSLSLSLSLSPLPLPSGVTHGQHL